MASNFNLKNKYVFTPPRNSIHSGMTLTYQLFLQVAKKRDTILSYLEKIIIPETDLPNWGKTGLLEGLVNKDKMLVSLMLDYGYKATLEDSNSERIDVLQIVTYIYPLIRRLYFSHFKGAYNEFVKYNNELKKEIDEDTSYINYNSVCSKYISALYNEFKEFYIQSDSLKKFQKTEDENGYEYVSNDYEVDGIIAFCNNYVLPYEIWA
jgi:hypothetical protein